MSTMAPVALRYLVMDRDRHGNERWYVRVPGQKKVRLRQERGTPSFFVRTRAR
jgi:integrase/recombinase XerD